MSREPIGRVYGALFGTTVAHVTNRHHEDPTPIIAFSRHACVMILGPNFGDKTEHYDQYIPGAYDQSLRRELLLPSPTIHAIGPLDGFPWQVSREVRGGPRHLKWDSATSREVPGGILRYPYNFSGPLSGRVRCPKIHRRPLSLALPFPK